MSSNGAGRGQTKYTESGGGKGGRGVFMHGWLSIPRFDKPSNQQQTAVIGLSVKKLSPSLDDTDVLPKVGCFLLTYFTD